MSKLRTAVPALAVLAALAGPAAPAAAAGVDEARESVQLTGVDEARESVQVTGVGVVSGRPDTLSANFGVEASAATVNEAMDRAGKAAARMRAALVRAGIEPADLQTSDVRVDAQRKDAGDITGYTASQGLIAKIRNLPQAGTTMSAAVAAGGDAARLNGATFTIEDDAALLAEARKKAFADARAKADLYAREAGRSLGRVVRVSEDAVPVRPYDQHRTDALSGAADAAAVPIEPGRQQLSVTVIVEWAFGPAGRPAAGSAAGRR
ncbi:SIMPL domain-containing protein [Actinoplanes sp. CA-054009]